jgi:ATP-dependent Clp protease ATP-binding subunit ClpC
MKLAVRLFIQKHADRSYTVATPDIPGISAYGPTQEECRQEVAEALVKHLAEMPAEELQHVALRRNQSLLPVTVELRPSGPQGKRRRNPIQITVNLLVTPEEDGQFLATAPRLLYPPLSFYCSKLGELAAIAQLELSQYFYDYSFEQILRYQASRQETIDQMEVEFKPKKAAERVEAAQEEQFWALRQAGIQLTAQVAESGFPRTYRREPEVEKTLSAVASEQHSSLVLVGPSGVGKTAIVNEVARRIWRKECPETLIGREVWSVTASSLVADASFIGQWEGRLKNVVAEVRKKRHILFVEDIAGLIEAGPTVSSERSMADFLKPHLQTGDVVIIGESTPERLRYAERRSPGFVAQFRTIPVEPTGEAHTLSILSAISHGIEQTEAVRITPSAIESAVEVTDRFLPYRAQPGKAIQLIEQMVGDAIHERASASSEAQRHTLTRKDVVATFTRQTGLPEFILSDDVALDLAAVQKHFAERVVGQETALGAMVNLIVMIKAGLNDPRKPLGSFLFIGPTGVGKTQLARALAMYLFGDEERVIRFDMSEYGDPAGVRRLIGAPGSGSEGELTGKVRSQPFCVLLLDEFEKADPLIYDLLLQVMGEGRLTDATGATTSFQNAIILMTSNLGASARDQRALGLVAEGQPARGREPSYWQNKVEQHFRPEFVNRIDQIVVFQPLSSEAMRKIARRELGEVLLRQGLTRRNLLVEIDNSVIDLLMEQGFSTAFGARPLKRAIEQLVVLPLARFLAGRTKVDSNLVCLSRRGEEVVLSVTQMAEDDRNQHVLLGDNPLGTDRKQRLVDDRGLVEGFAELRLKLQDWAGSDTVLEMRNERDRWLRHTSQPTFWDDARLARHQLSRFYFLERLLKRLQQLSDQAVYLEELAGLVHRQRDASYRAELAESYTRLAREEAFLEIELLGAHLEQNLNAILLLRPMHTQTQEEDGATWPGRLAAMYLRWAKRKGYDIEAVANLVPLPEDERASEANRAYPYRWQQLNVGNLDGLIKEVTSQAEVHELVILLQGAYVYGFLKGEAGVHRRGDRRPSGERIQEFAAVTVDVWSGAPDAFLSQILEARAREKPDRASSGAQASVEPLPTTAKIVRSFHFDSPRHVRDPRTKVRHNNLNAVLDGDLDDFILAYLRQIEPVSAWDEDE